MSLRTTIPDRLFHASRFDGRIAVFAPLSHFGTKEAALHRARAGVFEGADRALLYEVSLAIRRPLPMLDLRQTVHSWLKLADALHYGRPKILSAEDRIAILDASAPAGSNGEAATATLCRLLMEKGYDSIAYRNVHEDPGSLSFIILDPAQATVLSVREVADVLDDKDLDSLGPAL